MFLRQLAQGLFPTGFADEVRDNKNSRAPSHRAGSGFQKLVETGCARFPVLGALLHGVNQPQDVPATVACRYDRVYTRAIQQGANPVAMACEQARQHRHKSG